MKVIELSYSQLREILAISISNKETKAKLEELLSGKLELSEIALLELITNSGFEKEIIRILSGKDAEEIDAFEGLEYLAAFFGYIRVNSRRLSGWLTSIGLSAP